MEGGRNAKLSADKNNHSGQTRISVYVSPLSESPCKLLNRVVPDGTLHGVEWEGKIPSIRCGMDRGSAIIGFQAKPPPVHHGYYPLP